MKRNLLLILIVFLFAAAETHAQGFPSGFTSNLIGSGWSEPIGCCFNKTGTKLFVWEKGGKVWLCNRNTTTGAYTKQTTPVLDISPEVGNWRDHGLLGFALDPNFESNGLIYLMYVVDRHHLLKFGTSGYSATTNEYLDATIGRITRYKTAVSGSNLLATASTRTILLGETKTTGIPILHESHGVGALAFAADGTLLASCGDAASYNTTDTGSLAETYYAKAISEGIIRANENKGSFRSQMVNSLDGKILRIDPVTGNGISSNPFYNSASPRSAASRVWAMGFRNPYRFCVKPGIGSANPAAADLGELYVVDVGWNTYEELNIVRAPAQNCGWPLYEGFKAQSSYMSMSPLNLDELNPLYGISGCTKRYFNFKDLIKQATADNIKNLFNPCNASVQITTPNKNRFFHRIPSLDWKHYADSARVGIFSGNNLGVAQIGTTVSGVTGTPFQGNSGVAGCIYTGSMFPASYKNTFFFTDYGASWIKNITMESTEKVDAVNNFTSGGFAAIVNICENPADGSIFLADIGTGEIIRVSYGGNKFPVVKMGASRLYGPAPLSVTFNSSGTTDPEGGALTYTWNFGDGTSQYIGATPPAHVFTAGSQPKKFVVTLSVKDNANQVSVDSIIISANNTPPVVNITSPVKNSLYRLGADTAYALRATVTDAQHTAGQLKYEWQTLLRHNNHQHAEAIDTNKITSSVISRIGCNGETYYFMIRLKVTDAAGLSAEDSSKIFPQCTGVVTAALFYTDAIGYRDYNEVIWVTSSEINLSSFEVEKSCDGINFITAGFVPALRTAGMNNYVWRDNTPCGKYSYYRVKLVNIGSTCSYSDIMPVYSNFNKGNELIANPQPFHDAFILGASFGEAGSASIRLVDINGRTVRTVKENVRKGFNSIRVKDLSGLVPGVYIAEVLQDRERRFIKVIKRN